MDPQAHLTTSFGISPDDPPLSCHELLTQSQSLEKALVEIRPNLKLLSSGLNLAAAEQELVSIVGRETILRDAIANYRHECDYIFIDCPPSLGMLTLNALSASKELFIPVQPHFLSLQGLSQLLESILVVQKRINRLVMARLFSNMTIAVSVPKITGHLSRRSLRWPHLNLLLTHRLFYRSPLP